MHNELIVELAKVKAIFQQRAICAAMGIEYPASLSLEAQTASMSSHAAPVDVQDGGDL